MPALALMLSAVEWAVPAAGAATICANQGGTGGCQGRIVAALGTAANGDTLLIAGVANGDTLLIAGAANASFERLTIDKSASLIRKGNQHDHRRQCGRAGHQDHNGRDRDVCQAVFQTSRPLPGLA
jgi:hypothetical protein